MRTTAVGGSSSRISPSLIRTAMPVPVVGQRLSIRTSSPENSLGAASASTPHWPNQR